MNFQEANYKPHISLIIKIKFAPLRSARPVSATLRPAAYFWRKDIDKNKKSAQVLQSYINLILNNENK